MFVAWLLNLLHTCMLTKWPLWYSSAYHIWLILHQLLPPLCSLRHRLKWNWGDVCGHTVSHGVLPNRCIHLSAWCILKYHRIFQYREKDCLKKHKFLDHKAAASSGPAASSVSCVDVHALSNGSSPLLHFGLPSHLVWIVSLT